MAKNLYNISKERRSQYLYPVNLDPLTSPNEHAGAISVFYPDAFKHRAVVNAGLKKNGIRGVYIWLDKDGKVLYVGQSVNLTRRLNEYFSCSKTKVSVAFLPALSKHNLSLWILYCPNKDVDSILRLELYLILTLKPSHNTVDFILAPTDDFNEKRRAERGTKVYIYSKTGEYLFKCESRRDYYRLVGSKPETLDTYIDKPLLFRSFFSLKSEPLKGAEQLTPTYTDRILFANFVQEVGLSYQTVHPKKEQQIAAVRKKLGYAVEVVLENGEVKSYDSIRFAAKQYDISHKTLSDALKKYGFKTFKSSKTNSIVEIKLVK